MFVFLKERFSNYEVVELDKDFWDIVNPFGKSNIGIYEEKIYTITMGEEWRSTLPSRFEYIVHFDSQHRHFDEIYPMLLYIESIMNDEICAVGVSKDGLLRYCSEIASSELNGLTLDTLSREFRGGDGHPGAKFIIRSFSGKYDMDGRIENVDGKYTLIWNR